MNLGVGCRLSPTPALSSSQLMPRAGLPAACPSVPRLREFVQRLITSRSIRQRTPSRRLFFFLLPQSHEADRIGCPS